MPNVWFMYDLCMKTVW